MSSIWEQLESEVINDRYRLGELVHTEDHTAIFRTEAGQQRAIVHLVDIDPEHSAYYLSRWRRVARLENTHILRVLDSGEASIADNPVLFLVTEEPDDILASVLAERPMTEAETREVAESLADALDALHRNGLAHGNLGPGTVFAVGNQIKISGDGVIMSPDASAAGDVRALGLTLVACLTQHAAGEEELARTIASLPEPFQRIATRALDPDPQARWTAARIRSELQGPTLVERRPRPAEPARSEFPSGSTVKYAAITAGVALLGIIGYESMKPHDAPAPAVTAYTQPEQKPAPTTTVTAPPVRPAPVKRAAVKPRAEGGRSRITQAAPPRPTASVPGEHLVIVATYNRLLDAEKRAHSITSRFPKFPATVLAPHEPNPPYFVTIGANLSKDDAFRLQKRARAAGLPRDTYVTK